MAFFTPSNYLPLHRSPRKPASSPATWRFYGSAVIVGAAVYALFFHLAYGFAHQSASPLEMKLLTDPSAPKHPAHILPQDLPPPRLLQVHDASDYDAPFRLFNYHHLEVDELRTLVARTNGFFARDWSLWLGWNNMRYIIDAAFLDAKLLNRTLVLPSYIYARACEYDLEVCADYAEMVNRGDAMHTDQWAKLPEEQQMGWRVPLAAMLNLTCMRDAHPVVLISDYLRLHDLPAELERSDGAWDRERYHTSTAGDPSLFVVENEWYDGKGEVRVDYLPDDMKVRGQWTTNAAVGEHGTGSHWAEAHSEPAGSEAPSLLCKSLTSDGIVRWDTAVRLLKETEAARAFDLDTDAGVEAALHDAGWEVLYTFADVSSSNMAKAVVMPLRVAAPRASLRPWADEYRSVPVDVLLLAGETHNGRKPGSMLFTTSAAHRAYQRLVLHELVPVDALLDLAQTLAARMAERTQGRLWMGAHMRRGDFLRFHWGPGGHAPPETHLAVVKAQLTHGRRTLERIIDVEPYDVPNVVPDTALVSRDPPLEQDPFYIATDERNPAILELFRAGGAVLFDDLLTQSDRRRIGWPLLLADVRAVVEQALLAHGAAFAGSALSSVAGGVVNMRAARGADRRTTVVE